MECNDDVMERYNGMQHQKYTWCVIGCPFGILLQNNSSGFSLILFLYRFNSGFNSVFFFVEATYPNAAKRLHGDWNTDLARLFFSFPSLLGVVSRLLSTILYNLLLLLFICSTFL